MALRESEQKYRHLFEGLNDAAFLADPETGVILDVNLQAEVLLGRTRDEIVGMHQSQLHPQSEGDDYKARFREHTERGRGADYDGTVIRKDGAIVPVRISAQRVTVGGRRLMVGLFHDITERKRAEAEVRQTLAELERFNRLAIGRELRMIELKLEVNEMASKAGIPPPYDLDFAEAST